MAVNKNISLSSLDSINFSGNPVEIFKVNGEQLWYLHKETKSYINNSKETSDFVGPDFGPKEGVLYDTLAASLGFHYIYDEQGTRYEIRDIHEKVLIVNQTLVIHDEYRAIANMDGKNICLNEPIRGRQCFDFGDLSKDTIVLLPEILVDADSDGVDASLDIDDSDPSIGIFARVSVLTDPEFGRETINGEELTEDEFIPNQTVTLEAFPAEDYTFSRWITNDLNLTDLELSLPILTFPMPKNHVEITASYIDPNKLTSHNVLYEYDREQGRALDLGPGVYKKNQEISIVAQPQEGYRFVKWESDDAVIYEPEKLQTKFLMPDTDVVLFPIFEPDTITITLVSGEGGSISTEEPDDSVTIIDPTTISIQKAHGDTVKLIANPSEDFNFQEWTVDGMFVDIEERRNNILLIQAPTQNIQISASFRSQYNPVNIDLIASRNGNGYIVDENTNPPLPSGSYKPGERVELSAFTSLPNYKFVQWVSPQGIFISNSTSQSASFIMVDQPITITFSFVEASAELDVSSSNENYGQAFGDGSYVKGSPVTIYAEPNPGYMIDRWRLISGPSSISELSGAGDTVTFNMPEQDTRIEAVFKISEYNLTIKSEYGDISGQGYYEFGDNVTVSVSNLPSAVEFERWILEAGGVITEYDGDSITSSGTSSSEEIGYGILNHISYSWSKNQGIFDSDLQNEAGFRYFYDLKNGKIRLQNILQDGSIIGSPQSAKYIIREDPAYNYNELSVLDDIKYLQLVQNSGDYEGNVGHNEAKLVSKIFTTPQIPNYTESQVYSQLSDTDQVSPIDYKFIFSSVSDHQPGTFIRNVFGFAYMFTFMSGGSVKVTTTKSIADQSGGSTYDYSDLYNTYNVVIDNEVIIDAAILVTGFQNWFTILYLTESGKVYHTNHGVSHSEIWPFSSYGKQGITSTKCDLTEAISADGYSRSSNAWNLFNLQDINLKQLDLSGSYALVSADYIDCKTFVPHAMFQNNSQKTVSFGEYLYDSIIPYEFSRNWDWWNTMFSSTANSVPAELTDEFGNAISNISAITQQSSIYYNNPVHLIDNDGAVYFIGRESTRDGFYSGKNIPPRNLYKYPERLLNDRDDNTLPPIKSAYSGLTTTAFLTEDGYVYLSGLDSPDSRNYTGLPYLVTNSDGSDFKDIEDVSVGDNHILFLDRYGKVYGMGSNVFSQLGTNYGENNTLHEEVFNNILEEVSGARRNLDLNNDVYRARTKTANLISLYESHYSYPRKFYFADGAELVNIVEVKAGSNCSVFLDREGRVFGVGLNELQQLGIEYTVPYDKSKGIIRFSTGPYSFIDTPESRKNIIGYGMNLCPVEFDLSKAYTGLDHIPIIQKIYSITNRGNIILQSAGVESNPSRFYICGRFSKDMSIAMSETIQYDSTYKTAAITNQELLPNSYINMMQEQRLVSQRTIEPGKSSILDKLNGMGSHNDVSSYFVLDNDIEQDVYPKFIDITEDILDTLSLYNGYESRYSLDYSAPISDIYANKSIFLVMQGDSVQKMSFSSGGSGVPATSSKNILYAYGNNNNGKLGINSASNTHIVPRQCETESGEILKDVSFVSSSETHTVVLLSDGRVFGAGANDMGQLSVTVSDVNLLYNKKESFLECNINGIKDVSCGKSHTCFLKEDGTVWLSGSQSRDDINPNPIATQVEELTNEIVSVSCGWHHTLMLDSEGTVWGFGSNKFGQLGIPGSEISEMGVPSILFSNVSKIKGSGDGTYILYEGGKLDFCGALNHTTNLSYDQDGSYLGQSINSAHELSPVNLNYYNSGLFKGINNVVNFDESYIVDVNGLKYTRPTWSAQYLDSGLALTYNINKLLGSSTTYSSQSIFPVFSFTMPESNATLEMVTAVGSSTVTASFLNSQVNEPKGYSFSYKYISNSSFEFSGSQFGENITIIGVKMSDTVSIQNSNINNVDQEGGGIEIVDGEGTVVATENYAGITSFTPTDPGIYQWRAKNNFIVTASGEIIVGNYEYPPVSISGLGSYSIGERVSIKASIDPGYSFTSNPWIINSGSPSGIEYKGSNNEIIEFDMPSSRVDLSLNYTTNTYEVSRTYVGASNNGEIPYTLSFDNELKTGNIVTMTLTMDENYTRTGEISTVGQVVDLYPAGENSRIFIMPPTDFTVTTSTDGGYVNLDLSIYSESDESSGLFSLQSSNQYIPGQATTFRAIANTGYVFEKWHILNNSITLSDSQINNPEISIVMPGVDVQLAAEFSKPSYNVTFNDSQLSLEITNENLSSIYYKGDLVEAKVIWPEDLNMEEVNYGGEWISNITGLIESSQLSTTTLTNDTISFIMPGSNVNLQTSYELIARQPTLGITSDPSLDGAQLNISSNDYLIESHPIATGTGQLKFNLYNDNFKFKNWVYSENQEDGVLWKEEIKKYKQSISYYPYLYHPYNAPRADSMTGGPIYTLRLDTNGKVTFQERIVSSDEYIAPVEPQFWQNYTTEAPIVKKIGATAFYSPPAEATNIPITEFGLAKSFLVSEGITGPSNIDDYYVNWGWHAVHLYLTEDNTLYIDSQNIFNESYNVIDGVKDFEYNNYAIIIIKLDGTVFAIGNSAYGELGIGGDPTKINNPLNHLVASRYQANFSDLSNMYGSTLTDITSENLVDVDHYSPNDFGFYNMHGNVRELCSDLQFDLDPNLTTNPSGEIIDLSGATYSSSTSRLNIRPALKGGSARMLAVDCQVGSVSSTIVADVSTNFSHPKEYVDSTFDNGGYIESSGGNDIGIRLALKKSDSITEESLFNYEDDFNDFAVELSENEYLMSEDDKNIKFTFSGANMNSILWPKGFNNITNSYGWHRDLKLFFYLRKDKKVFAMGKDRFKMSGTYYQDSAKLNNKKIIQLSDGSELLIEPHEVEFPAGVEIVDVASSHFHTLFLTSKGDVYGTGYINYCADAANYTTTAPEAGEERDTTITITPTLIASQSAFPTSVKVSKIFVGPLCSFFVLTNGETVKTGQTASRWSDDTIEEPEKIKLWSGSEASGEPSTELLHIKHISNAVSDQTIFTTTQGRVYKNTGGYILGIIKKQSDEQMKVYGTYVVSMKDYTGNHITGIDIGYICTAGNQGHAQSDSYSNDPVTYRSVMADNFLVPQSDHYILKGFSLSEPKIVVGGNNTFGQLGIEGSKPLEDYKNYENQSTSNYIYKPIVINGRDHWRTITYNIHDDSSLTSIYDYNPIVDISVTSYTTGFAAYSDGAIHIAGNITPEVLGTTRSDSYDYCHRQYSTLGIFTNTGNDEEKGGQDDPRSKFILHERGAPFFIEAYTLHVPLEKWGAGKTEDSAASVIFSSAPQRKGSGAVRVMGIEYDEKEYNNLLSRFNSSLNSEPLDESRGGTKDTIGEQSGHHQLYDYIVDMRDEYRVINEKPRPSTTDNKDYLLWMRRKFDFGANIGINTADKTTHKDDLYEYLPITQQYNFETTVEKYKATYDSSVTDISDPTSPWEAYRPSIHSVLALTLYKEIIPGALRDLSESVAKQFRAYDALISNADRSTPLITGYKQGLLWNILRGHASTFKFTMTSGATGGTSSELSDYSTDSLKLAKNNELSKFIKLNNGSFQMGVKMSSIDSFSNERTINTATELSQSEFTTVNISSGILLCEHCVTNYQYNTVQGISADIDTNSDKPKRFSSLTEINEFIKSLNSSSAKPSGWVYTLPTQAEWEYACSAGTNNYFSWLSSSQDLQQVGSSDFDNIKKVSLLNEVCLFLTEDGKLFGCGVNNPSNVGARDVVPSFLSVDESMSNLDTIGSPVEIVDGDNNPVTGVEDIAAPFFTKDGELWSTVSPVNKEYHNVRYKDQRTDLLSASQGDSSQRHLEKPLKAHQVYNLGEPVEGVKKLVKHQYDTKQKNGSFVTSIGQNMNLPSCLFYDQEDSLKLVMLDANFRNHLPSLHKGTRALTTGGSGGYGTEIRETYTDSSGYKFSEYELLNADIKIPLLGQAVFDVFDSGEKSVYCYSSESFIETVDNEGAISFSNLINDRDDINRNEFQDARSGRLWKQIEDHKIGINHEILHYETNRDISATAVLTNKDEIFIDLEAHHGKSPITISGVTYNFENQDGLLKEYGMPRLFGFIGDGNYYLNAQVISSKSVSFYSSSRAESDTGDSLALASAGVFDVYGYTQDGLGADTNTFYEATKSKTLSFTVFDDSTYPTGYKFYNTLSDKYINAIDSSPEAYKTKREYLSILTSFLEEKDAGHSLINSDFSDSGILDELANIFLTEANISFGVDICASRDGSQIAILSESVLSPHQSGDDSGIIDSEFYTVTLLGRSEDHWSIRNHFTVQTSVSNYTGVSSADIFDKNMRSKTKYLFEETLGAHWIYPGSICMDDSGEKVIAVAKGKISFFMNSGHTNWYQPSSTNSAYDGIFDRASHDNNDLLISRNCESSIYRSEDIFSDLYKNNGTDKRYISDSSIQFKSYPVSCAISGDGGTVAISYLSDVRIFREIGNTESNPINYCDASKLLNVNSNEGCESTGPSFSGEYSCESEMKKFAPNSSRRTNAGGYIMARSLFITGKNTGANQSEIFRTKIDSDFSAAINGRDKCSSVLSIRHRGMDLFCQYNDLSSKYWYRDQCQGLRVEDCNILAGEDNEAADIEEYAYDKNNFMGHMFGFSMAFNSDGSTLAIGSPGEYNTGGTVRLFQLIDKLTCLYGLEQIFYGTDLIYNHKQLLGHKDNIVPNVATDISDAFGFSVDLSSDGNVLAVGAPQRSLRKDFAVSNNSFLYDDLYGGPSVIHNTQHVPGDQCFQPRWSRYAGRKYNSGQPGYVKVFKKNTSSATTNVNAQAIFNGYLIPTLPESLSQILKSESNQTSACGIIGGTDCYDKMIAEYEPMLPDNTTYTQELQKKIWYEFGQKITGQKAGDNFGYSVSINHDGTILSVGSPSASPVDIRGASGRSEVFHYETDQWKLVSQPISATIDTDLNPTLDRHKADTDPFLFNIISKNYVNQQLKTGYAFNSFCGFKSIINKDFSITSTSGSIHRNLWLSSAPMYVNGIYENTLYKNSIFDYSLLNSSTGEYSRSKYDSSSGDKQVRQKGAVFMRNLLGSSQGNTSALNLELKLNPTLEPNVISSGDYHTVYLKSDDTVWAAGSNYYGQLGDGTTKIRTNPVQVTNVDGSGLSGVVGISAGGAHTVYLKSDETVWAAGENDYGQLGDGTQTNSSNPVQVDITNVVSISTGINHTVYLKNDGTVWAAGRNTYGQLGDGTENANGEGIDQANPVQVDITNVVSISAGANHTVYLKNDGTVWAAGRNGDSRLGDGTATQRNNPVQVMNEDGTVLNGVFAISTGNSHTVYLKSDGTVWAAGDNDYGQLGDGAKTNRRNPVQVKNADGSNLSEVIGIFAGGYHTVYLKNDGTVWATGWNSFGQLGDGTYDSKVYPAEINITDVTDISSGKYQTVYLKSDGTVWATGNNGNYHLATGGDENRYNIPVETLFGPDLS
jgi:alpha-tubulin suppressor-like RCC1 family protein